MSDDVTLPVLNPPCATAAVAHETATTASAAPLAGAGALLNTIAGYDASAHLPCGPWLRRMRMKPFSPQAVPQLQGTQGQGVTACVRLRAWQQQAGRQVHLFTLRAVPQAAAHASAQQQPARTCS